MEKSGTGIGLFLSREIIEKHGGTIMVTSGKKKKGSTFVIQLPSESGRKFVWNIVKIAIGAICCMDKCS